MQRVLFFFICVFLICVLSTATSPLARAEGVDAQIAVISSAGAQGGGSAQAREACQELSQQGPVILPRLLSAMDTPNIVAANWYRAAYERIVAREFVRSRAAFPVDAFKTCVRDRRRQGRVRRLALDLVNRIEPAFQSALVPTLLDDPEFRDDAVAVVLHQGDAAESREDKTAAKRTYERAFQHARNPEQVTAAARKLEALGEKVSIAAHLGLVTEWFLIGPFTAPGMTGFRTTFPPESGVDLEASVSTEDEKRLHWTHHQTSDPFGTVDLVRVLGPVNEAVGYAYTEIESPKNCEAQLRTSADDCLAVWLNGQKVFGREMWLNGTRFDRFITPLQLKAGRNRILVKICQGPHHRDPAVGNAWTFQLRFCSADGEGLAVKVLPAGRQSLTRQSNRSAGDQ